MGSLKAGLKNNGGLRGVGPYGGMGVLFPGMETMVEQVVSGRR